MMKFRPMRLMRPPKLTAIKGISKVLQITWSLFAKNLLNLRQLSCFTCNLEEVCPHYSLETIELNIPAVEDIPNNELCYNYEKTTADKVQEGSWIVVIYYEDWYPGVIERREGEFLSVNFMSKSGQQFSWSTVPDIQTVEVNRTLCAVDIPPHPVSNRHFNFEKGTLEAIQAIFESVLA